MLGTLLLAVFCIVLGIVLTLAVQYYVLENYFESLPIVGPTDKPTVTQPKLPEELAEEVRKETYQRKETCLAINLLVQMLFGDLVHTPRLRQWVLNKIHLEFQELMARTSVGKLFHNIRINELDLGGQMPVFKSVTTQYVSLHPVTQTIEQLDLKVDVEYNGGLKISILADIVLNRKGFVFLKINRLSGQVLLRFSRRPFSHWAYSFIGDPTIEVEAESQFQGRPLPRVTAVIVRQIKRTLRKRHTLPNYKLRYKPFFTSRLQQLSPEPPEPPPPAQLEVTVKRLSRLRSSGQLSHVYCRLAVGAEPLLLDTSHVVWSHEAVHVPAHPGQAVGLLVRDTFVMEKQCNCITVFIVVHNAPAYKAGLKAGDIVDSVDGHLVRDLATANRLLRQPHRDITVRVLRMAENKEAKNSTKRASVSGSRPSVRPPPTPERRLHSSVSESLPADESPVRRRRGTRSVCAGPGLSAVPDREDSSSEVSLPAAIHNCVSDQEKITKLARWNEDPVFNETFQFAIGSPHRYLNLSVLGVPESGAAGDAAGQDVLLARLSLPLASVVAACHLTAMGHHVEVCRLLPPSTAAVKEVDHELSVFNAFEPTFCFGDALLSFLLGAGAADGSEPESPPEEDTATLERMDVEDSDPEDDEEPLEIRVGHKFARMKFTASTECDFCKRKIWLKDAFQCSACLMTCHKRCISRCQSQTTCQAELNRGWRDSISDSHLPEIVTSSEDASEPSDKKRRRRLNTLMASLGSAGMKRTGSAQSLAPPAAGQQRGMSTSLPPSPQRSPAASRKGSLTTASVFAAGAGAECDSDEELDVALSNMQRCANNENLVLAARELGCQLYCEMEPAARRDRLENMVSKLQAELDSEERRRQELLRADRQADGSATHTRCALLLAQSDEKTKMLGILMVYYNAGLRDAEQAAAAAAAEPAAAGTVQP